MITLRASADRHHQARGARQTWSTFHPGATGPSDAGFGLLRSLDEDNLPPRAINRGQRHCQGDLITYVRTGALAYANSTGLAAVIHAGEFQCISAMSGLKHREANASHLYSAHVFQMGFRSDDAPREPRVEQKRFSAAERRDALCPVASLDGREGSLRMHEDAVVYAALLGVGQHVVHALAPTRAAWLHVVTGRVGLYDVALETGDGAGVIGERAVPLTAKIDSEILLFDVAWK